MRFAVALAATAAWPPSSSLRHVPSRCDLVTRIADDADLLESSRFFEHVASVVATCMFAPRSKAEAETFSRETKANLVELFAGARRRLPVVGRSALIVAEDNGRLVGSCGLQILSLTPDGRGESLLSSLPRESRRTMSLRPLLSNVAVLPEYRRRGIGSSLVADGEALAREWGFDEMLLLVNAENAGAQALYSSRGYRIQGGPLDAEECATAWYLGGGITWQPCKNVCMRRVGLLHAAGAAGTGEVKL